MRRRDYIDAEFEIVSDARALPGRSRPSLRPLQWAYVGMIAAIALFTAVVLALPGPDPFKPDEPRLAPAPAGMISIPPVPSSR